MTNITEVLDLLSSGHLTGSAKKNSESEYTTITTTKSLEGGFDSIVKLYKKIILPKPNQLSWSRQVYFTDSDPLQRAYDVNLPSPTTEVISGVKNILRPSKSNTHRFLGLTFIVPNDSAFSNRDDVEKFLGSNLFDEIPDNPSYFDITIKKNGKKVVEYKQFRIANITIDRTPFNILTQNSYVLHIDFSEAYALDEIRYITMYRKLI